MKALDNATLSQLIGPNVPLQQQLETYPKHITAWSIQHDLDYMPCIIQSDPFNAYMDTSSHAIHKTSCTDSLIQTILIITPYATYPSTVFIFQSYIDHNTGQHSHGCTIDDETP